MFNLLARFSLIVDGFAWGVFCNDGQWLRYRGGVDVPQSAMRG